MRREERETARGDHGQRACGPHRAREHARAGCQADALGHCARRRRHIESAQQRDALAQRRLEGDLAAHGALGDGGHLRSETQAIGELVDAFLLDDRRVHVGQEQALASKRGRLHDDVDRRVVEGSADRLAPAAVVATHRRCKRKIEGARVQPSGRADPGQHGGGPLEQRLGQRRPGLGDKGSDMGHLR